VPVDTSLPVIHELAFRLSYGDCDPAGIVYYAAYYPWFERVYTEWAYLGGHPTERMHELWGATHVSVSSGCTYRVPGRLNDPFTARMRLGRLGTTSFTMTFTVDHRETRETYADGFMTMVFVDRAELGDDVRPRPVPIPEGMRLALRTAGYADL
jgi:acyl-CoA thioester hydrolase